MASLDDQIQSIQDKARLHRFIDELPDDGQALILLTKRDPDDEDAELYLTSYFGGMTLQKAFYCVERFKAFVLRETRK